MKKFKVLNIVVSCLFTILGTLILFGQVEPPSWFGSGIACLAMGLIYLGYVEEAHDEKDS